MALSAFDDKAQPPTEKTLLEMLGRTSALWILLKKNLEASHGPLAEDRIPVRRKRDVANIEKLATVKVVR